jgi:tripartite-type tricarboxylate transporter receptor subunit TctC
MTRFFFLLVFVSASAFAQYPSRPVRVVVPYPPGGGADFVARLVTPKMSEGLGQPIVIENRPGAAGNIGADQVAKSAPDGYTLLFHTSTVAMSPGLGKQSYDLLRDLTGVAHVAETAMVIGVNPAVPAKSLAELIALAKEKPGTLAYSTCGNASPMHLAGELLKMQAGIDLVHVPYKGCAPALADVLGGQVAIAFNTISNTVPMERAGKIRLLAVASAKRSAQFPNLPTIAEAARISGYEAAIWFGIFAPAATPREIVSRLNEEANRAARAPDVSEKLSAQYYDVRGGSAEEFSAFVRAEVARWSRVIRDAGIKGD